MAFPQALIDVSRRYGADPAFVLAGGGNTSFKTADRLWVKASGHSLATIGADGFVELDRAALQAMLHDAWPDNVTQREALFQQRVMAARVQPELGQRPSVEALLHHLLPGQFVVHTHPGLVNAMGCCSDGASLAELLFGPRVVWQPYVDPGLTLALALERTVAPYREDGRRAPHAIVLANHGLFVFGDAVEFIDAATERIVGKLRARLHESGAASVGGSSETLKRYQSAATQLWPALHQAPDTSSAILALTTNPPALAAALRGPLTPDQIVYCRSEPLWVDQPAKDEAAARGQLEAAYGQYRARLGYEPWVILVRDAGAIALRESAGMAEITRSVFSDAAGVYVNAARLGGVTVLEGAHRKFIEDWEVESYRRGVAHKSAK